MLLLLAAGCSSHTLFKESAEFGTRMARQGLWREAEFRWKQALEIRNNDSRLLNNLAVALETQGRYDEALELYRKALKLDPKNKHIKRNYEALQTFMDRQRSAVD